MGKELYIDGKLVDLSDETRIGITLEVNDIAEMKDRQSTKSNVFKTPRTKVNRDIYEQVETIVSKTGKPYQKLSAKYVEDGMELIPSGFAIFEEAGEFFEQTIFSGIQDFFSQIKGKKLSDLDLSDLDHTWDAATVFSSRVNVDGYLYPIIDWSDDQVYIGTTARDIDVRTLFTAMFIHELVTRIFAQTNYAPSGSILSTSKWKNLLFPFALDRLQYNEDFLTKNSFKVQVHKKVNFTKATTINSSPAGISIDVSQVIFEDEQSLGMYDNASSFSTILGSYIIPSTGKWNLKTVIDVSVNSTSHISSAAPTINVIIEKVSSPNINLGSTIATFSTSWQNLSQVITATAAAQLNVGDQIIVRVVFNAPIATPTSGVPYTVTMTLKNNSTFEGKIDKGITFGGTIFMSAIQPEMEQVELLKTLALEYGLTFVPDNVKKIIYFRQFKDLYANKPNARDWTSKLDKGKPESVRTRFGNYGQVNQMKYQPDATHDEQGRGDGFFRIDDQTLPIEKELFTLKVAASEDVTRMNGLPMVEIAKLHLGGFKNKTQPRIVMLDRQNITGGDVLYKVNQVTQFQSSADIPLTRFIDDTKTDSLGFDRYLINSEYKELVDFMLKKTKVLEAFFNLDITDIDRFDFFIPVYLKQYSSYFYVNKIENYQKGKSTKVQLIRM
jgi:aspartate 1-decarboxylase